MIFVCPHFPKMSREMLWFHRLYAFPCQPEPPAEGRFVILDSGAFGLAERGARIGIRHMQSLASHYRPYVKQPDYHCIAPDVFLNPSQTIRNWQWWQENVGLPIVPVIQFPKRKRIDIYSAMRQAQYYAAWRPRFVAISNPSLTATESGGIVEACTIVREITGAAWLHNLGAGWSPEDVMDWRDLGCFDSIDSIAYYTDAQDGWLWRRDGGRERFDRPWRELAVENARVAVEIARVDDGINVHNSLVFLKY